MEEKKMFLPLNLQFFAENNNDDDDDDDNSAGAGDQANNPGDTNVNGGAGSDQGNGDSGQQEKTFTQAEVNAMMAKEKRQGKSSVYNELGIDPNNQQQVAMFKAFMSAMVSDEDKAKEQIAQQQAAQAEAEQRALVAEAKVEALQLGILPQYVDDAVALATTKLTEDTDFKTIIGEFKTKYPVWFESDDDDKGKVGQRGTGATIPNGKDKQAGGKNGGQGMGSRLAAAKRASQPKKSFWAKD